MMATVSGLAAGARRAEEGRHDAVGDGPPAIERRHGQHADQELADPPDPLLVAES
jgi:hypothetical protein